MYEFIYVLFLFQRKLLLSLEHKIRHTLAKLRRSLQQRFLPFLVTGYFQVILIIARRPLSQQTCTYTVKYVWMYVFSFVRNQVGIYIYKLYKYIIYA